MLLSSWVAAQLAASLEGLSSMKLGDLLIILDLHKCDKYTVAPKILHV
jgi:hypothetical protein